MLNNKSITVFLLYETLEARFITFSNLNGTKPLPKSISIEQAHRQMLNNKSITVFFIISNPGSPIHNILQHSPVFLLKFFLL